MNYLKASVILVILTIFCANFAPAQIVKLPEPRQEKLLNGMKLLVWNEPRADKATVKLRIHNGAAFDPKDKMGVMALLADILFPTEEAKSYFTEDLEGSLEIIVNYDYIQITATGKTDEIQAILETLATVVSNPQITDENFALVRGARLEKVRELEKNPSYVADRAVAARLFGDFPYGRSADGTIESLAKIDRADLLLARDRFFTADNATLAVIGNVKPDFVYRAARQLFGAWKKSEGRIPATFRQPDAPDTNGFAIEIPNIETGSNYSASVAAARADSDFFPTMILTGIWRNQFCLNDETKFGKSDYRPHLLRGVYIIAQNRALESEPINARMMKQYGCQAEKVINKSNNTVTYPSITQTDFESEKSKIVAEYQRKFQNAANLADFWLDVDTYKLVSIKDEFNKLNKVTLADVQRVAEKQRNQPQVHVWVRPQAAGGQ